MTNSFWDRVEEIRGRCNVLEHSFYARWSAGELTGEELADYAGEYRHAVGAIAEASATAAALSKGTPAREALLRHAAEEASHIPLWDGFVTAVGGGRREPAPETAECVAAWTDGGELLPTLVTLYAIESGQPEISRVKREGLLAFYGVEDGPATDYFALHAELDREHAAEARDLIEEMLEGADQDELAAVAESAFRGYWTLLDGVERRFGRS